METGNYELEADNAYEIFEFKSNGPNEEILKRITYLQTEDSEIWNVSMGDVNEETLEVDYMAVSNNQDLKMLFVTVSATIDYFFSVHLDALVYITGNTKSRTRLYQIGIATNLDLIFRDYTVLGERDNKF